MMPRAAGSRHGRRRNRARDGHDWDFAGTLRGTNHRAVGVDGLWAIAFGGDTVNNGPSNTLFFAAGPNDESAGAVGTITVAP